MHYQFLFAFALLALWAVYRKMRRSEREANIAARKHLWKRTFFGTFINGY